MSNISHYLLLEKIEIEAANTISSPLTYGFPAITGFLGAVHALNRKFHDQGLDFSGVLIACNDIEVHRFRPHPYTEYTFNQSRNPIKKDGKTASIIEEGKVHLTVSLVIEISASLRAERNLRDNQKDFERSCKQAILQQRIAGGSTRSINRASLFNNASAEEIKRILMPAFVLMDARSDLIEITEELQKSNPEASALDGLIEVATLHHEPESAVLGNLKRKTRSKKAGRGWLVPMPVGYQALIPEFAPGELENCRDASYSSQYVESIYSLGKWVFPNRLHSEFRHCFWRHEQQDNLYLATQNINSHGELA